MGKLSFSTFFFNAVRDNAVGGHKAVHVHSLQIVQNLFLKQVLFSELIGNFKISKWNPRITRKQLCISELQGRSRQ